MIALVAGAYQVFALVSARSLACFKSKAKFRAQSFKARFKANRTAPVSVLKPIRGPDDGLREAIRSHVALQGDYELLCGVGSLDDPAVALIARIPIACA